MKIFQAIEVFKGAFNLILFYFKLRFESFYFAILFIYELDLAIVISDFMTKFIYGLS